MEQILFHDNYVIAVLVLLWGLCFCRNLLESFTSCVKILDQCVERDVCCVAPCISMLKQNGCGEILRQAVVLFCFLQPAVFCVIYLINGSRGADHYSSTILHNVKLNSSSLRYVHTNGSLADGVATVDAMNIVQIDYLFLVLPFSVMVSATSLLWVHCINISALNADTKWDTDMPECVFVYETFYYIEIWTMNLSCIAVMCAERSWLEIHYSAMALSLMVVYVLAQARVSSEYSTAEHFISIVVMIVFFCVLVPLWIDMLQTACVVAVGIALVHAIVILSLATFHTLARGEATAGQVLLVRVGGTIVICIAHIVIYSVGRNHLC